MVRENLNKEHMRSTQPHHSPTIYESHYTYRQASWAIQTYWTLKTLLIHMF